jgi:hypothetical protein
LPRLSNNDKKANNPKIKKNSIPIIKYNN